MKTKLHEAMTSGVFVEVRDSQGHGLGQAVFTDWKSRPLPAAGDTMCCVIWNAAAGRKQKVQGRVASRHFELQQQADGQPCVWAHLIVDEINAPRQSSMAGASPRTMNGFSRN